MQLYSAKIRLSGSFFNEVQKSELTAAEIVILKRMHGGDAVLDIKKQGNEQRSDTVERARLNDIYALSLRTIEGVKTLDALLGPTGVPLPKYVEGVDDATPVAMGQRAAPVEPTEPEEPAEDLT